MRTSFVGYEEVLRPRQQRESIERLDAREDLGAKRRCGFAFRCVPLLGSVEERQRVGIASRLAQRARLRELLC